MHDFEKLGAFYLGKRHDLAAGATTDELLLYDAKDLTTHAVCVGMTGSGKTGLCLALLEEAAIDGVPAIAIDPKGDLGNLLLTFPDLAPSDFRPWIDESAAARAELSPDDFAEKTAQTWREGLASWGQDGERIRRFKDGADVAIYTPGSSAGLQLTVLRSFAAPPAEIRADSEALRDRIEAATSGLLALLDIDADPVQSREHILIATLLDRAWQAGKDLDLPNLIRQIQSPPVDRVGIMDLESFFAERDRMQLAMKLNNLLASPTFASWLEGEPLDIKRLLYTPQGKPRISIISIAHLSDAERMFMVTILLNEILTWTRGQAGTSSLRALLYMDEVFGYFPPTAEPPSKKPMLTLLKQARAYGVGVVLATQNPVDLDYKGLSNTGTWFLGRLQTERDKLRVLEGLEGASAQAGSTFNRGEMEATLAGLGSRKFLMNNVHEDEPVVFETRWVMSYLRGPLTRDQIGKLMADRKLAAADGDEEPASESCATMAASPAEKPKPVAAPTTASADRPLIPPEVPQLYMPVRDEVDVQNAGKVGQLVYRPALFGQARVHFVRLGYKVDHWDEHAVMTPVADVTPHEIWNEAEPLDDLAELAATAEDGATFADVPGALAGAKNYRRWSKSLKDHLYRSQSLTIWNCAELKQYSHPHEAEDEFRIRLGTIAREKRDEQIEKLRKRYAPKLATAGRQILRAEQRLGREQEQYDQSWWDSVLSVGSSAIGALFGRKLASRTNVTKASSSVRKVSRAARERGDVGRAEESLASARQKLVDLEAKLQGELDEVDERLHVENLKLEELSVRARKSDLTVGRVGLLWMPWYVDTDGSTTAAY